jgi:hypothetical protein
MSTTITAISQATTEPDLSKREVPAGVILLSAIHAFGACHIYGL